jgi:hypothetical protein
VILKAQQERTNRVVYRDGIIQEKYAKGQDIESSRVVDSVACITLRQP